MTHRFDLRNSQLAIVEQRGRQCRVCAGLLEYIAEVVKRTAAADAITAGWVLLAHKVGQRQVEARLGAISIH